MGIGKVEFDLSGPAVPAGATPVALDEDATGHFAPGAQRRVEVAITEGKTTLTDEFGPLAAHVYRISLPTGPPK
jgi:hypothetical protein